MSAHSVVEMFYQRPHHRARRRLPTTQMRPIERSHSLKLEQIQFGAMRTAEERSGGTVERKKSERTESTKFCICEALRHVHAHKTLSARARLHSGRRTGRAPTRNATFSICAPAFFILYCVFHLYSTSAVRHTHCTLRRRFQSFAFGSLRLGSLEKCGESKFMLIAPRCQ